MQDAGEAQVPSSTSCICSRHQQGFQALQSPTRNPHLESTPRPEWNSPRSDCSSLSVCYPGTCWSDRRLVLLLLLPRHPQRVEQVRLMCAAWWSQPLRPPLPSPGSPDHSGSLNSENDLSPGHSGLLPAGRGCRWHGETTGAVQTCEGAAHAESQ